MSSIVVVGAGREGKGFLGEVYSAAGWEVCFIDTDPEVIAALRGRGAYTVKLFTPTGVRVRGVSGYLACSSTDELSYRDAVVNCDLIALCVYPEDIAEAARYLAACLAERARRRPDAALGILACTNKNHILPDIVASFRSHLPDENSRSWFDRLVQVRDTIVRRSVGAESNRSLELEAQVFLSLLIQSPLSVDLTGVEWMEQIDGLELLKEVKLYTYNAPHAACAYAGYLAGCQTISEAMTFPEIAAKSQQVLEEAIQGVSSEFGIDVAQLRAFSTLPALPEDIVDHISRVAYDPIRKLAGNERLVGVARFCLAHGIEPDATISSIVDALQYDEPTDPNAVRLQSLVAANGVAAGLSEVSGLPVEHELVRRVAEEYLARAHNSHTE